MFVSISFPIDVAGITKQKKIGYLIYKKKFSSDYLQGSSCVLRLQQVRKGKTILVKRRREGRGRRGERVGGEAFRGTEA